MGRDSAAGVLSLHLGGRCGRYSSDWPSLYLEMDCLDRASEHKQVRSKILLWQSLVSAAKLSKFQLIVMPLLTLISVLFFVEMLYIDVDTEVRGVDRVSAALILTLFQK